MEFVVVSCGGCGAAVRTRQSGEPRRRACPRCGSELDVPMKSEAGIDARWVAGSMTTALLAVCVAACWVLTFRPSPAPPTSSSTDSIASVASSVSVSESGCSERQETVAVPDRSGPPHGEETILALRNENPGTSEITAGGAPRQLQSDEDVSRRPLVTAVPVRRVSSRREDPDETNGGRFRVQDDNGRPVVARLHGRWGDKSVLILPDGQLGIPSRLVPADEPFRPLTADELLPRLQRGPLGEFQVTRTPHYLIFYRSSQAFAESSGRLLEELYKRLLDAFRKNDVPVHDAEFPLVAVIYRTEREFRAKHDVEPVVQAFYEIYTNRITFFETSDQDQSAPEISALRKPQTVAHEGTHQILQNIGVHPRLSSWPIWLVEGLAEYCATPAVTRKGGKPAWDGLGMVNGLHMATIRELDDPLSMKFEGDGSPLKTPIRMPGKSLVESLIRKTRLTPTEYSLAWAMTHYLAFKRQDDFVSFLKRMSQLPPLKPMTADDHLAEFVDAFGGDLVKLDRTINSYLRKLDSQKHFDRMPYYTVMYEQVVPTGLVRRARVSQSPQVIWQWVQEVTVPQGARPAWQAIPHDTRGRAIQAAQDWIKGSG